MGTCDFCGVARSDLDVIDDSSDTGMSQSCFACHPDQNFIKENYMPTESELTLCTDSIPTNNVGLQSSVDRVCQHHGIPDIKIGSTIEFEGYKGCIVGGNDLGEFVVILHDASDPCLRLISPDYWVRIFNHKGDLIYSSPDLPDIVNSPPNHNQRAIECMNAIKSALTPEEFAGYCKGKSIKYIWDHLYKGEPEQQIKKAQWYLNKMGESHEK